MRAFPPPTTPRQLMRVLDRVAAGTRRPRALAEALDIPVLEVEGTLAAAEWLGLVRHEQELQLTTEGLQCCLAGPRRPGVYGDVVRAHPVLGALLPQLGDADPQPLVDAVRRLAPTLDGREAARTARGLRRLARPALRRGSARRPARQLGIGFGASPLPRRKVLDLRAGVDENPDVYTFVLRTLLDHGELDPSRLRGALDAFGGAACPIGGYLAMATRRGDATRHGDVLVVSRGAVARASLADSTVTVALSDPAFREWLEGLLQGRGSVGGRFRVWLDRLMPGWLEHARDLPAFLAAGIDRLLFGRPLATVPLAGDPGEPLTAEPGAFLTLAGRRGLAVALPSNLALLSDGLPATNRALRAVALEASGARPPGPADRRLVVHGGLHHPGEAATRMIPDGVSLRLRAASHVPAFALLLALGALDRRGTLTVRARAGALVIEVPGRPPRTVAAVVAELAAARGWVLVAGPTTASWDVLADTAEQLGLLARVFDRYTLDEAFFARLQHDPEHRTVWEDLQPLADLLLDRLVTPLAG